MRSLSLLILTLLLAPAHLAAQPDPLGNSLDALQQRFTIRQAAVSSVQKKGKAKEEIW